LDGLQPPFADIEAMAAYYIQEIRAIQPHGPYYLGGASYGGSVAFEMAQQLHAQGQHVALLAMFDNEPPNIEPEIGPRRLLWRLRQMANFLKNLPYWFNDFRQHPPQQMLARLKRKLIVARKEITARLRSTQVQPAAIEAEDIIDYAAELSEHRRRLIETHYQAMNRYFPKPYHGRVTLFQAQGRPLFSLYFPDLAWQKLALAGLDIRQIPGSHEGMFKEPHVRLLARELRAAIEHTPS
jgi:thioesterase domain-containing protein